MEEKIFSSILTVSANIAEKSRVELVRELSKEVINDISSAEKGVFIIAGVRGSGKTTILGELYGKETDAFFANAEVILRHGASLLDFLHYSNAKGYKTFLIDEIHALPDWEKDIKLFFDETKKKIIVSGSSAVALKVKGSELARRASFYETKPLSFREYIFFRTGNLLPKVAIGDIISPAKRKELEKGVAPYLNYFSPYSQFDALPAAFFAVFGSKLQTAPLTSNILPSVTRKYVIRIAKDVSLEVIEKPFTPKQAADADELFIAVSTKDIVPAVKFNEKTIAGGTPGEVTKKLIEQFHFLTH